MGRQYAYKRMCRPVAQFFVILGSLALVEFVVMSILAQIPEMSVLHSALFDVESDEKTAVRLVVELPEGLPPISCNPQQVELVVLNILRNAFQAVVTPARGTERERVIRVQADTVEMPGRINVRLTLANNGPPIPRELLEAIREPFFSTKPVGTGTGLGLSISSDIMKAYGGTLDITREPGEFTQMILCFPAVMGKAPSGA